MSHMEKYEATMRIIGPSVGDDLRKVPEVGLDELKRLVGWRDEDVYRSHDDNPAKRALGRLLRAHRAVMSAVIDAQKGPAINPNNSGA